MGVWATNGDPSDYPSNGLVFAVNGFAREFSDWGDGSTTGADFSLADDGVSEAEGCVG